MCECGLENIEVGIVKRIGFSDGAGGCGGGSEETLIDGKGRRACSEGGGGGGRGLPAVPSDVSEYGSSINDGTLKVGRSLATCQIFSQLDWHLLSTATPAIDAWLNPGDKFVQAVKRLLRETRHRSNSVLACMMTEALDIRAIHVSRKAKSSKVAPLSRVLLDDPSCQLMNVLHRYLLHTNLSDIEASVNTDVAPDLRTLQRGLMALTRQWKRLVYMPAVMQATIAGRLHKHGFHPQQQHRRRGNAADSITDDDDDTPGSGTETGEGEGVGGSPLKTLGYGYQQSTSTGNLFNRKRKKQNEADRPLHQDSPGVLLASRDSLDMKPTGVAMATAASDNDFCCSVSSVSIDPNTGEARYSFSHPHRSHATAAAVATATGMQDAAGGGGGVSDAVSEDDLYHWMKRQQEQQELMDGRRDVSPRTDTMPTPPTQEDIVPPAAELEQEEGGDDYLTDSAVGEQMHIVQSDALRRQKARATFPVHLNPDIGRPQFECDGIRVVALLRELEDLASRGGAPTSSGGAPATRTADLFLHSVDEFGRRPTSTLITFEVVCNNIMQHVNMPMLRLLHQ
ncbi:PREDICTED: uncharacterized protein LOC106819561, partial [Priapulus caudatus]|uniref:Uncharacterized protein LOC106819561 n=1 Tax=Priapulus caudatus TaxID=37621 RepID=A0ABM1F5D9_PRICU